MKIIKKDYVYISDVDVLVRIYENQDPNHIEQEQICGEVLFKQYINEEHKRFTAWLPRGIVNGIVTILKPFKNKDWKVQISNELPDNVGVLTSCRSNFERSMEWDNF